MRASLSLVGPGPYQAHPLHGEDRAWPETNCYVDLWIELLHSMGLDPTGALAFTVALDYEGDQLTFFKFPLEDLYESFGIDTLELQVWKPLPEAVLTQLRRGRPVIVELDSYHLPDTAGVSYGQEHVKTSVAVHDIDLEAKTLGYFHGRSYFRLSGEDYDRVFRIDGASDPRILPPYFEVAKLDHLRRPSEGDLRRLGASQLRRHLRRRPQQNPVRSFAHDFVRDVEWLRGQPSATFHAYSFATLRQLGANFECAAAFARFLGGAAQRAAEPLEGISTAAKAVQFRLARVSGGKRFDPSPSLERMAEAWEEGLGLLASALA